MQLPLTIFGGLSCLLGFAGFGVWRYCVVPLGPIWYVKRLQLDAV